MKTEPNYTEEEMEEARRELARLMWNMFRHMEAYPFLPERQQRRVAKWLRLSPAQIMQINHEWNETDPNNQRDAR